MKRLKLRGKEVKRLGIKYDKAISLALNLVSRHYTRNQKTEVLELLEKLVSDPDSFKEHEIFRPLAELITQKPEKVPPKTIVQLHHQPLDFHIFGLSEIDSESIEQMRTAMRLPIMVDGALMPDAHVGYGLPIGGVVAADNAIIPYGVGMDIGCRMCMSVYSLSPDLLKWQTNRLKNILLENTRFGLAEFSDISEHEIMERKEFSEIKFLKTLQKKAFDQLGTSGHGNHFVDMGILEVREKQAELNLEPGNYFAILSHSGSRNLGSEICKNYTRIAREKLGLSGEAARLAWLKLNEEEGIEYWLAMNLAGDYSAANHHIIHQKLASALGEKPLVIIENHHNFAWKEQLPNGAEVIIHRKGATPAHTGAVGIIPGSMTTPAFVVKGKGNPDSLNSTSHGAGRLLSRRKAKSTFTLKDLQNELKVNDVVLIGGGLDEVPMAYKNILKVMEYQKDLVDILAIFYPRIVRME